MPGPSHRRSSRTRAPADSAVLPTEPARRRARPGALLQHPLGGLSFVESGPVLFEAQVRERSETIEGRRDSLELAPDDRRIDGAHARPSRSRNAWIARRRARRSLSVSQYRRDASDWNSRNTPGSRSKRGRPVRATAIPRSGPARRRSMRSKRSVPSRGARAAPRSQRARQATSSVL